MMTNTRQVAAWRTTKAGAALARGVAAVANATTARSKDLVRSSAAPAAAASQDQRGWHFLEELRRVVEFCCHGHELFEAVLGSE
jgi:hypothetical protein